MKTRIDKYLKYENYDGWITRNYDRCAYPPIVSYDE
jgi:hypothetical protein